MKKAEEIFCLDCLAHDEEEIDGETYLYCHYNPPAVMQFPGEEMPGADSIQVHPQKWCVLGRQYTIQEMARRRLQEEMEGLLRRQADEMRGILSAVGVPDTLRKKCEEELERIEKSLAEGDSDRFAPTMPDRVNNWRQ